MIYKCGSIFKFIGHRMKAKHENLICDVSKKLLIIWEKPNLFNIVFTSRNIKHSLEFKNVWTKSLTLFIFCHIAIVLNFWMPFIKCIKKFEQSPIFEMLKRWFYWRILDFVFILANTFCFYSKVKIAPICKPKFYTGIESMFFIGFMYFLVILARQTNDQPSFRMSYCRASRSSRHRFALHLKQSPSANISVKSPLKAHSQICVYKRFRQGCTPANNKCIQYQEVFLFGIFDCSRCYFHNKG